MNAADDILDLKRQCVELLFDCPHRRCDAACPFAGIRREPEIVSRVAWLKRRSAGELRDLVARHAACRRSGAPARRAASVEAVFC